MVFLRDTADERPGFMGAISTQPWKAPRLWPAADGGGLAQALPLRLGGASDCAGAG